MKLRLAPPIYLLLIGATVAFWSQLDALIYPADVFPRLVLVLVAVTAAIALIQDVAAGGSEEAMDRRFLFAFSVAIASGGYIWLITVIGYYVASALFLIVFYPVVNFAKDGAIPTPRLFMNATIATGFVIGAIYVVFALLLKINVPMLLVDGPI